MQAQTLSISFRTAQSGTHTCNLVFRSVLPLNLLVLVTYSETSKKFLLGKFNSITCVPYATQFWVKVQFYHRFNDLSRLKNQST